MVTHSWSDKHPEHQHAVRIAADSNRSRSARPTLNAPHDRCYSILASAQTLPRALSVMLFGSTHAELDMTGAHYEIICRIAKSVDLLPIQELRNWLSSHIAATVHNIDCEVLIKRWPLVIINSNGLQTAVSFLQRHLTVPVNSALYSFAATLHQLTHAVISCPPAWFPASPSIKPQGKAFRFCEIAERVLTFALLQHLQQQHPHNSIVWLHDGFWITPPPSPSLIASLSKEISTDFDIVATPPLFRFAGIPLLCKGTDNITSPQKHPHAHHPKGGLATRKRQLDCTSQAEQQLQQQLQRMSKRNKSSHWSSVNHHDSMPKTDTNMKLPCSMLDAITSVICRLMTCSVRCWFEMNGSDGTHEFRVGHGLQGVSAGLMLLCHGSWTYYQVHVQFQWCV